MQPVPLSTQFTPQFLNTARRLAPHLAAMDLDEIPDQYFTYDGRLASFQVSKPAGKRKSNTKGKAAKALTWPHQHLDPESVSIDRRA